ncbi:hypothetical protein OJ996_08670 [Luteolibacter sp. GHJ8]|uniref:Uncharacterized protein n=1 Tax=Luteolibacter rhizosphaerae TaxID=2989719 RepID=A0ABT3G1E4_9BACT|nr:hypothetical protein [Luteolibacter rhizosphaerae]MCW1913646.1 hypothetical protein [Luteolibacter rhizosphaerae]
MKHHDAHDEIGALLRGQKPEANAPPGLESRILRDLDRRQRPVPERRWIWFVAPAAIAAVIVLIDNQSPQPAPASKPQVVQQNEPEEETNPATEVNPLKRESLALTRDARRAGRFLIDCLPSASAK